MSQKSSGKDINLVNKLNKLKEKQDNWMKERDISNKRTPKSYVHSSLKTPDSSSSAKGRNQKSTAPEVVKKTDAVVWTTNSNYNGFVVRNGSGSVRSRQNSARTTPAKKTFTHSSLKNQISDSDVKKPRGKKLPPKSDDSIHSDESLSTSFTEQIANLEFDDFVERESVPNKSSCKKETNFMANHFCVLCEQAMSNEERKPTMVFPCAHSFCQKCIVNKGQCPNCKCEIISTQTNSALYAVIQQFKQKTEREEMEKKEKKIRTYLDEYKTLNTRINLMKGEATNIIDEMEDITHRLIDEQDTINDIEYNIEEFEREIQTLRQQIQLRHQDLDTEKTKVKTLERRYDKQKGQLDMLQKTIDSLTENKEKVREMVGDLSPDAIVLLNDLDEEC